MTVTPICRPGSVNSPSAFETVWLMVFVATCVAVTSAPGTTAPLESTTSPVMVEVVPPCVYPGAAAAKSTPRTVKKQADRLIPPSCKTYKFQRK